MRKYRIADLVVGIESRYERVYRQAEPYRIDDGAKPDFCLAVPEDKIDLEMSQGLESRDDAEYVYMRFLFQRRLIDFDGLVLHSSGVVCDGRAYLFSANSGTGKSTHTQLWIKRFGADRTFILNDDAPALRRIDGRWFAYGAPWSGSSPLNTAARAPLQGIAFLERSETNWTRQIDADEAITLFMAQSMQPLRRAPLVRTIDKTIELLKEAPVFRVGCNMSEEAAQTTRDAMLAATPKQAAT